MALLRDQELYDAIQAKELTVENLPPLDANNWYAKESPIQPASLDLHIGAVYLPGKNEKQLGSAQQPLEEWSLKTGQTAVVLTMEKVRLPRNFAAIGFPPSHVSVRGLLMTNPGHVDPGYSGPMRFTVINMGSEPYALRRGEAIVSLLLFKLSADAHTAWFERGNKAGGEPTQEKINRLCEDFVDVEKRAKEISYKILGWAGLVALALSTAFSLLFQWYSGVSDLKAKVASLESQLSVAGLQKTVGEIDNRLKTVEKDRSTQPAGPGQEKPTGQPESKATRKAP